MPRPLAALALPTLPGGALAATDAAFPALAPGAVLYLGFVAALVLHNLLPFIASRERGYLAFAVFAFALGLGHVALGQTPPPLPGAGADLVGAAALPAGFALAGLSAALFTRGFLDTKQRAPSLDVALKAAAGVFAIALAAVFVAPGKPGHMFVSLAAPGFAALAILCGLRCRPLGAPGTLLFVAGWTAILAGGLLLGATRFVAWLADSGLAVHAMQVTSALGMLVLSFALAERTGAQWRERATGQAAELANNEHLIESLQASEQFLTQSLAQRNVELEAMTKRLQESEQRYLQISHHDPLTGLANQFLLTDRIEQAIIRAKRHNTRTGVIMLDIEEFRSINDGYGQDVGDEILKAIALRLRGIVREQDTVARPEGDLFVIVLEEVFDSDDLQRVATAVSTATREALRIGGHTFMLDAAIGCALSSGSAATANSLVKQAGKLLRRAQEGKRLNRPQGGDASIAAI